MRPNKHHTYEKETAATMPVVALMLTLTILIDALIQGLGQYAPDWWRPYLAMLIGMLIAFGLGVDAFALLGIPVGMPTAGFALTGLVVGRCATHLHTLVEWLRYRPEASTWPAPTWSDYEETPGDEQPPVIIPGMRHR